MMSSHARGLIFVFIALVSAATIPVITKIALNYHGDPSRILLLRFFIVTLFLSVYMRLKKQTWLTTKKQFCGLIGLGFAYVNVSLLFFLAMKYISPSLGSLILYTYPVMVALLSALFLKETFTFTKGVALVLVVAGCCLVLGVDMTSIDFRGVLLAFLTALFFSIYIVGNKMILHDVAPVVSLAYMSAFCVIFFGCKALAGNTSLFEYHLVDIVTAIVLAVVPTIIGILALFKALELLGASQTAIISSFEPVVTLLLAYVVLGDRVSYSQLCGAALILGGVLIIEGRSHNGKIKAAHKEVVVE